MQVQRNVPSFYFNSQYHDTCIPAGQRQPQLVPQTKPVTVIDYTKCTDQVTEDKMWKQAVHNEEKCVKQWTDNWAFLTQYDNKVIIFSTRTTSKGVISDNLLGITRTPQS